VEVVPTVSVVIPSFRSKAHVANCLQALAAQHASVPFETILVDSSDDDTAALVLERFPWVRIVRSVTRLSAGAARNLGVSHARAPNVLFTDTDCTPAPDWLAALTDTLADSSVMVVGGAMVNGTPRSATGSVGFYLEFFRFLGHRGTARPVRFLVTANFGMKREALSQYSFSDDSLGEDMHLSWQISKDHPGAVWFVPAAKVSHANRTGLGTLLRYQHKIGQAAVRYRSATGPEQLKWFRRFPLLTLGLPAVVLPWVGIEIARRGSIADLARYICLLPLTLAANLSWLRGFREELGKG
jgi:GT2 family glycosyltransferase